MTELTLTPIELVKDLEAKLLEAMAAGKMDLCISLSEELKKARKLASAELAKVTEDKFVQMGEELLNTPLADFEASTLSDLVVAVFEKAEELVGDKADFALRFSRDFTKPYVAFAKITKSHPKTTGEAHIKDPNATKVSSNDLLQLVGTTVITQEMATSKYIKDFIGLTFAEANSRIVELQKEGIIKDGNPKYQLKLAMERIAG
jgi:hypothetical protein